MIVGCGKERIWELITHHPVMHFPKMPDYKVLGQLQLASQLQNPVRITWWKSRLLQWQVTPQEPTISLPSSPEVLILKESRLMLDFVIQKNITSYAFDPRIHSEKMLDYLESN